jgi:hypothetical protein
MRTLGAGPARACVFVCVCANVCELSACAYVCMCEREFKREKERKRETERDREREAWIAHILS